MKREYSSATDAANLGFSALVYGDTGIGKTRSILKLPDPILLYNTEPRDPRRTLHCKEAEGKVITIREFDTFDEYMDDLDELYVLYEQGKRPFKAVFFDSLSFIQGRFKIDMEDDRTVYNQSERSGAKVSNLTNRFKIEQSDWGSLGSMMKRITSLLNKISKFGVYVIATATLDQYPSWNREMEAAPFFQGKDFGQVFKGYFDFIGLVSANSDGSFPPRITFVSDGTFIAKCCSDALTEALQKKGPAPLNWEKILKVIEGK